MHDRNTATSREESGELGNDGLVGEGASHLFIERRDVADRQSAIDGVNRLLHFAGDGAEVSGVANLEVAEAPVPLGVGKVIDITDRLGEIAELHVLGHADHLLLAAEDLRRHRSQ